MSEPKRLPPRLENKKRPAFNSASLYGITGDDASLTKNQLVPTNSISKTPLSSLYQQVKDNVKPAEQNKKEIATDDPGSIITILK